VKTFIDEEMDAQLGNCKLSVHEVGLIDLLDIVRLTERLPNKRALVGIQPLTIADWSDKPTETIQKSIPRAAAAVNALIEVWQHEASR